MELSLDLWGYLSTFIENDKQRCYLMMTCKEMLLCKIYFYHQINIEKIINTVQFDYFTNVYAINNIVRLPKYILKLSLGSKVADYYIPSTIKKLTIGFNRPLLHCSLPTSVTYWKFDDYYNQ